MSNKPKPPADAPKPAASFLEKYPAADVLRRCFGLGNEQAVAMAATLGDADRTELAELAKLPNHGPAVHRLLDDVADRRTKEEGERQKAKEGVAKEGATDRHG